MAYIEKYEKCKKTKKNQKKTKNKKQAHFQQILIVSNGKN